MEIEFIKELALTMKEIDINELEYSEKNGERIKLKRNNRFKSDFEGQKNIREYNDLDNCQSSYEKKDYTDNTIKNIDNQNDVELERNEKNKQEASEKLEEEKNKFIDFKEDDYIYLEPKLKCAIEYLEKTKNGHLRHPVFKGIRLDK